MTRRTIHGAIAAGTLGLLLAACGGAASPSPSASTAAELPSQAAPSVAAPSVETGSGSGAPPSISLPSDAKDLEALLPDTVCGQAAVKTSVTGDKLAQTGGSDLAQAFAALAALGKSSNDFAMAIASSPSTDCNIGIMRITGIDTTMLQSVMMSAVQQGGESATQTTVGGKTVYKMTGGDNTTYVYFSGDKVVFASAKSDADAQAMLQNLP
jgi:hypothetical protein